MATKNKNQLSLDLPAPPDPTPKRMVSFGLNAVLGNYGYYRRASQYGDDKAKAETHGFAIIVDTRNVPLTLRTLWRVMNYELFECCKTRQVWFTQCKDRIVVAGLPFTAPSPRAMAGLSGGLGCIDRTTENPVKKIWSYENLGKRCGYWERSLSDCENCEYSHGVLDCLMMQLHENEPSLQWIKDTAAVGTRSWRLFENWGVCLETPDHRCKRDPRTKQIMKVFEKIVRVWQLPIEVVHPRHLADNPFMRNTREVDGFDFSVVEEARARERDRSVASRLTRSSLARCKSECTFYGHCEKTEGCYKWATRFCQGAEQRSWSDDRPFGPFSKAEIDATRAETLAKLTPERRRDIEFIALNGGQGTWLLGHTPLTLGKLSPTFDSVSWFWPGMHTTKRFSIADSIQILKTPYRYAGQGVKCQYRYPAVKKHEPIDDNLLFIYLELCSGNKFRVRKANRFTGHRWDEWIDPSELRVEKGGITVRDRHGDRKKAFMGHIDGYANIFARTRGLPNLMKQYLERVRPAKPERAGTDS